MGETSRPKRASPGRSCSTKYQPGIAACSLHLLDGEIEAEKEDIIRGTRLIERRAGLRSRRILLLVRGQPIGFAQAAGHLGVLGEDHRVGILLQQLSADDQHGLRLRGLTRRNAVVVVAQRGRGSPAMDLGNVVELLFERVFAQTFAVDGVAHRPELPEVAAALVGRVFAPQQLARKLVVQADHVRFDEALVGFHQRDAVARDLVDVGQQPLDGSILERLVHRQVDLGISHDLVEVFADLGRDPWAAARSC